MGTKANAYWRERFEILNESLLELGEDYLDDLMIEYNRALHRLNQDILRYYERFAYENEVSLAESRKILTARELEEFRWTVDEYIRRGQENAVNQRWLKQLENASIRIRLSRLESLEIQIRQEMEILAAKRIKGITNLAEKLIKEGYYKTIYEIQREFGISDGFDVLSTKAVEQIVAKPWAPDGKSFSDRIWADKEKLSVELKNELSRSFIRGDGPDQAIKNIARKMKVAKSNAGRLVMTESAYFASASRLKGYQELGVKKYYILATLDLRTSMICQEMDGKVFDLVDYEPGVTANPFHPWCRTTTAPSVEGFSASQRYMRDPVTGKGTIVESMDYKEWYQKYVVDRYGQEQSDIMRKMIKNESQDFEQYKRYKKALGEEFPTKSFAEFQELKYNRVEEWDQLKREYSTVNAIGGKNWSDSYKQKVTEAYYEFRKEGVELSWHGAQRFVDRSVKKDGTVVFTKATITKMFNTTPNYVQTDGRLVNFKDEIALVRNPATNEVVSIIGRKHPKEDWLRNE